MTSITRNSSRSKQPHSTITRSSQRSRRFEGACHYALACVTNAGTGDCGCCDGGWVQMEKRSLKGTGFPDTDRELLQNAFDQEFAVELEEIKKRRKYDSIALWDCCRQVELTRRRV